VIGSLADQENGRHEDIRSLGDQFRLFHASKEVGANRRVQAMLLERGYGNEHHIRSSEQISDLRPSHMRQIVLDLLLSPQRIGLGPSSAGQEDRQQRE
jgi:hypothetical protein